MGSYIFRILTTVAFLCFAWSEVDIEVNNCNEPIIERCPCGDASELVDVYVDSCLTSTNGSYSCQPCPRACEKLEHCKSCNKHYCETCPPGRTGKFCQFPDNNVLKDNESLMCKLNNSCKAEDPAPEKKVDTLIKNDSLDVSSSFDGPKLNVKTDGLSSEGESRSWEDIGKISLDLYENSKFEQDSKDISHLGTSDHSEDLKGSDPIKIFHEKREIRNDLKINQPNSSNEQEIPGPLGKKPENLPALPKTSIDEQVLEIHEAKLLNKTFSISSDSDVKPDQNYLSHFRSSGESPEFAENQPQDDLKNQPLHSFIESEVQAPEGNIPKDTSVGFEYDQNQTPGPSQRHENKDLLNRNIEDCNTSERYVTETDNYMPTTKDKHDEKFVDNASGPLSKTFSETLKNSAKSSMERTALGPHNYWFSSSLPADELNSDYQHYSNTRNFFQFPNQLHFHTQDNTHWDPLSEIFDPFSHSNSPVHSNHHANIYRMSMSNHYPRQHLPLPRSQPSDSKKMLKSLPYPSDNFNDYGQWESVPFQTQTVNQDSRPMSMFSGFPKSDLIKESSILTYPDYGSSESQLYHPSSIQRIRMFIAQPRRFHDILGSNQDESSFEQNLSSESRENPLSSLLDLFKKHASPIPSANTSISSDENKPEDHQLWRNEDGFPKIIQRARITVRVIYPNESFPGALDMMQKHIPKLLSSMLGHISSSQKEFHETQPEPPHQEIVQVNDEDKTSNNTDAREVSELNSDSKDSSLSSSSSSEQSETPDLIHIRVMKPQGNGSALAYEKTFQAPSFSSEESGEDDSFDSSLQKFDDSSSSSDSDVSKKQTDNDKPAPHLIRVKRDSTRKWCQIKQKVRHGDLDCTIWSHKKECELKCHKGYSLPDGSNFKCKRDDDKWEPEFTPCKEGEEDSDEGGDKEDENDSMDVHVNEDDEYSDEEGGEAMKKSLDHRRPLGANRNFRKQVPRHRFVPRTDFHPNRNHVGGLNDFHKERRIRPLEDHPNAHHGGSFRFHSGENPENSFISKTIMLDGERKGEFQSQRYIKKRSI